jgi:hypothetical protein
MIIKIIFEINSLKKKYLKKFFFKNPKIMKFKF